VPALLVAGWARASDNIPQQLVVRAGPDDAAQGAYGSISSALADADPGAVVTVTGGYYAERVVVSKPVRLQAATGAAVVVEHETEAPYESTLQIDCSNVVLVGLTVRHNSPSIAANYALLVRSSGDVSMERCSVSSASGSGLGCEGGRVAAVSCTFAGSARHGAFFSGDLAGESPLGESVLDSCALRDNKGDGAILRDGALVTLRACTLDGNSGSGLFATDSALQLVGCTLRQNKRGSITATRMLRFDVEGLATDVQPVLS